MTIEMVFEVDELDHEAIADAIARHQRTQRVDGEYILPDGEGDLHGRILAEICRGWCEFMDLGVSQEDLR